MPSNASAKRETTRVEGETKTRIAQVDADSKKEIVRVGNEARERIAKAERESGEKIAAVNVEAGRANEKAGEANERAGKLANETEDLKKQRMELEKSLAPRTIPLIWAGGKRNFEPLVPLAGTKVILEVLPDAEAFRASSEIENVLREARWEIIGKIANPAINFTYFDGVTVETYRPERDNEKGVMPTNEQVATQQREMAKAQVLVDFLKSYDWVASVGWGNRGEIPPGVLKVKVGFKPSVYFRPQQERDAERRIEDLRKPAAQPPK